MVAPLKRRGIVHDERLNNGHHDIGQALHSRDARLATGRSAAHLAAISSKSAAVLLREIAEGVIDIRKPARRSADLPLDEAADGRSDSRPRRSGPALRERIVRQARDMLE